jgi:hypothetical protein
LRHRGHFCWSSQIATSQHVVNFVLFVGEQWKTLGMSLSFRAGLTGAG